MDPKSAAEVSEGLLIVAVVNQLKIKVFSRPIKCETMFCFILPISCRMTNSDQQKEKWLLPIK